MKYVVLSALGAAALSGCTSGGCDTGDSSCKGGGGGGTPLLQDVGGECSGGECVWTAAADGEIGTVELYLVETGDPTNTGGCDPQNVENGTTLDACGVWSEYHNEFDLFSSNNEYGGDTKELQLTIVGDYTEVVMNESTIFNLDADPDGDGVTIGEQTTVMFVITDSTGAYADCATYGDDPGFFSSECTSVW